MALRDIPTEIEKRHQETAGTETIKEKEPLVTHSTLEMEKTRADESTNKKKQFCQKFLFSLFYEFCWSGIVMMVLCLFQQSRCKLD